MSTLQISLIAAGGLVIAAVIAYNAWTAHKSGAGASDAHESAAAQTSGVPEQPSLPANASLVPPSVVPVTLNQVLSTPERPSSLDALIDAITTLHLDSPVLGQQVLAAMPAGVGGKPFAVEAWCQSTAQWERPRPDQRYSLLQAGVQLANRTGPLNKIEFSEYVVKTQAFADALGAAAEFPDMHAEISRAVELDAFASQHDAHLSLNLRARRAAWSLGYVVQHAQQQGFTPSALPGCMLLRSADPVAAPILSLTFDPTASMGPDKEPNALREISILLEVTHVPRSEHPFERLCQIAQTLAQSMDGVLTDDAGQPLSPQTIESIGTDINLRYDALDSRDLSAGSAQARRLFS